MENQAQIDAIQAQIDALKAEAKALMPKKERVLSFKVGEKGTVCVYGLQKFPVSLYPSQWVKLFKDQEKILAIVNAELVKEVATEAKTA